MNNIFKKFLASVLVIAMVFAQPLFSLQAAPKDQKMTVNQTLVTKSTVDIIKVEADLGADVKLDKLSWTFGDKKLSDWKTLDKGVYTENSFISFEKEPYMENGKVKAEIKFDLVHYIDGKSTTDLSTPRSNRSKVLDFIGDQVLKVTDMSSGNNAWVTMNYRPYKDFMLYDEIKGKIDEVLAAKTNGVYTEYQVIGKSYEGRDMHFVILAKDKETVDTYLKTLPDILKNPAKYQDLLKNGKLGMKVPMFINNIHPDEYPGVDAQLEALKILTTQKTISYKTYTGELEVVMGEGELLRKEDPSKAIEVTLDVEKALDKVFFLFNFTENPDGRYYNTRQNARGFDINRDNATQLQPESKYVVAQIAKWTPVSFLDLHGFVDGLLVEPCTPPHDPNYDYDLLMEHGLPHAKALGKAAIANTKYETYQLAQDGMANWDDAAPNYTATYALHHGSLGNTIEIPEGNYDSVQAAKFMILESTRYIADNFNTVYNTQLEYFKRGVTGSDEKAAVDPWLVDKDNKSIGRPRGNNDNFFPDYYVIPNSADVQKNPYEAYNAAQYMIRNGIAMSVLQENVFIDGKLHKKGSYVVDMKQAKRGLANAALWAGPDVSSWDKNTKLASGLEYEDIQMYAELILNLPAQRGFDCYAIHSKDAFKGKLVETATITKPSTKALPSTEWAVIESIDNNTIKAINELLSKGAEIHLGTLGYTVKTADIKALNQKYYLELIPYSIAPTGKTITMPNVYTDSVTSKYTLKDLGFKVVDKKADADVIVDSTGSAESGDFGVKTYIGYGKPTLKKLQKLPEFAGLEIIAPEASFEALVKVNVEAGFDSTLGYGGNDYGYISTGSMITAAPANATIIAKTTNDCFVSGWYPENEMLDSKIYGFETKINGKLVSVFSGDLMRKEYAQHEIRYIANVIYQSTAK